MDKFTIITFAKSGLFFLGLNSRLFTEKTLNAPLHFGRPVAHLDGIRYFCRRINAFTLYG